MTTLQMDAQSELDGPLASLTPREVEVVRWLASGLSKQETAARLRISPHTVNRHTTNLMAKLGVHRRAELTRLAIRAGLVEA
jgi:DNA-binding CsgD family transcriptional regulator